MNEVSNKAVVLAIVRLVSVFVLADGVGVTRPAIDVVGNTAGRKTAHSAIASAEARDLEVRTCDCQSAGLSNATASPNASGSDAAPIGSVERSCACFDTNRDGIVPLADFSSFRAEFDQRCR